MIIDEEPVSELTLEVINDGIEDTSETTSLGGTPKPDDESVVAPEHFVEQNQNVVEKPKIEKKKLSEKKLAQLKKARESKMRKREAKKIEDAKDIIAKASESEPPPPLERLSDGPPPEPKEISEPIEIVYKKKKKKKRKLFITVVRVRAKTRAVKRIFLITEDLIVLKHLPKEKYI